MAKDSRHFYLRDYSANKRPVGCVAVELDRATNVIRYALSACSPNDKWNSVVATAIAMGRLKCNPIEAGPVVVDNEKESTHVITRRIMEHITATNQDQSHDKSRSVIAFQAASGWLTNYVK